MEAMAAATFNKAAAMGALGGAVAIASQLEPPGQDTNPWAYTTFACMLALGALFWELSRSKDKRSERAETQVDSLTPLITQLSDTQKEQGKTIDSLVTVVEGGLSSVVTESQKSGAVLGMIREEYRSDHKAMFDEIRELRVKMEAFLAQKST